MKYRKVITVFSVLACIALLGSSSFGQETVKPLNWRELTPFLKDLPGWEAEDDASGNSMDMGAYAMTTVEREYNSGDKSLKILIVDGGYAQMAYASFNMMRQFEMDTSEEYLKKVEIKGFPGVEKYSYEDKEAMIMLLVGDRFMISLEEEEVEDTKEAKALLESLDLEKLAGLAK